jgi:hypothetical protein
MGLLPKYKDMEKTKLEIEKTYKEIDRMVYEI